jgi:rSAM/selenodomain-associated transferase 1
MRRQLIVFARAPVRGQVKRRLACGIGAGAALAFYRRALATVLRRVARDRRWRTVLAVTPDRAVGNGRRWPGTCPRVGQGRGDLGLRMARSLRGAVAGPVCLIGADIPDIEPAHIWRAFRALAAADLVFGPAEDGGYWLIGCRGRPLPRDPFATVRWSGPHALADTLARFKGRRIAFADRLADVDDAAAYRRWREKRSRP